MTMQQVLHAYSQVKNGLADEYGLTEDILHMHSGLLIFFAAAVLFRRRMRSWVPIGLVYFFALANEMMDLLTPGSANATLEPVVDVINTVFWPTMLFLLARRRVKAEDVDKVQ